MMTLKFNHEVSHQLNVKPGFKTTHVYRIAKRGVLFPSQSKVRVDYPGLGLLGGKLIRLKTDMTYEKHKFFIVETDHKVIKRYLRTYFFSVLKIDRYSRIHYNFLLKGNYIRHESPRTEGV